MTVAAKALAKRQKAALWAGLNDFTQRNGGWIVSSPDRWPMRLECPPLSELPDKLEALGYEVCDIGTAQRVTCFGPSTVEVFQLDTTDTL
jgi:hypothetical protein